ncbi:MAG TPA: hypothetical protein VNW97_02520, partial [Candidatus Saccharimonadales bacterium]|nr:hypothetical protein [Candidatus Saccharimonadales bacterium]
MVFALAPDPVHTHLSLFFDRHIDALQQATQDAKWIFDEAILPWDNKNYPESTDFHLRQEQSRFEEEKEKQPGLLIFRHAPGPSHSEVPDKLLVFVIGETATAGIHKEQFRNAIALMKSLLGGHTPNELRILGPTFSGSLQSLADLLSCSKDKSGFPCGAPIFVYSGTVTDCSSVLAFHKASMLLRDNAQSELPKRQPDASGNQSPGRPSAARHAAESNSRPKIEFRTLQEYDVNTIDRFLTFAVGYQHSEVAVLSEDETGYGRSAKTANGDVESERKTCVTGATEADVVHLYFPRGISQLRSAYQHNTAEPTATGNSARTTLPLDLEAGSNDDDSVRQYAHHQMPLSQEAVLLGIVSELKSHSTRLVLLRATDPIDKLFLARYLRTAYPQGRIITVGADLLFAREIQDAALHGVMALTNYTLTPGAEHQFEVYGKAHSDRVFPSSDAVGAYNAMALLLAAKGADLEGVAAGSDVPISADDVHLEEYDWPVWSRSTTTGMTETRPPIRLMVLGHNGFWNTAVLPTDTSAHGMVANQQAKLGAWVEKVILRRKNVNVATTDDGPAKNMTSGLPLVSYTHVVSTNNKGAVHMPNDWKLFGIVVVGMSLAYVYFIWTASMLSSNEAVAHLAPPLPDSRKWLFAATGYLHFALLAALLWASEYYRESAVKSVLLFLAMVLVMLVCAHDLVRRHSKLAAYLFLGACILTLLWLDHIWGRDYVDYMFVWRSVNLSSGVSPLLPILLLLCAYVWAAWYTLSGAAVVDDRRRPILPSVSSLGGTGINPKPILGFRSILEDDHKSLLQMLLPDKTDLRTGVIIALVISAVMSLGSGIRLIRTLESSGYEVLLSVFIVVILALIVSSVFRLIGIWSQLRRLLVALDASPFRRGFKCQEGFSWSVLFRFGTPAPLLGRILRREAECFQKLVNLKVAGFETIAKDVYRRAQSTEKSYDETMVHALGRQGWQLLLSPKEWVRGINKQ